MHTPGPWNAAPAPRLGFVAWTDALGDLPNTGEEGDANARLIAAAPDLLAALRALVGDFDDWGDVQQGEDGPDGEIVYPTIDAARAAIAQATGEGARDA